MGNCGVHLLSFAAGSLRWKLAGERLGHEAKRTDAFQSVRIHNRQSLFREIPSFRMENPDLDIRDTRGFGFWLWRPYLLRQALYQAKPEDLVVFLDAGCQINWTRDSQRRFNEYLDQARTFGSLTMSTDQRLSMWCKADTLSAFDVRRQASNILLIQPGVLFFRRTEHNLALMDSWIDWGRSEAYHHIDDSPSNSANTPDFKEHRHDQALLTCLNESFGLNVIPQETYFPRSWSAQGHAFPIWAMRNSTPFSLYSQTLTSRIVTFVREKRQDKRSCASVEQ